MTTLAIRFAAGDHLHLWMRPLPGHPSASVTIAIGDGEQTLGVEGASRAPLPVVWESAMASDATLAWTEETTHVSLAYTFSPATVAEAGIHVVWTGAEARLDDRRYKVHFGPLFGWMNDPNGLCEVDGVTHLFYQHSPHGRRWETMHWGHAVSRDGIAWVHQPIALLPRENLLRGEGKQGGAYSGTALPRPDGTLRLFYTDREDSRVPAREWQVTTVLRDGGVAGPSTVLLDVHPPLPGYRNDWRDPFVFEGPDGGLKMLLGGADSHGTVVLLYETADREGIGGWRFVDVLIREASTRSIPAECPCMIRLDGSDELWVLIFALIGSRDEATRRRNLTRTHIGRFDGRHFVPLHRHELDFGPDCYAMQAWRGADGPRAIAWAANWTDVVADRDFDTAMTLPRRLVWQDGRLLTPPIDAVETLRVGNSVALDPGGRVQLEEGLAELVLSVEPGTRFRLTLDHPTHEMALSYDGRTLEFHYDPPGNRSVPRYRVDNPGLTTVRVFVDVGLIEVYADGGRACCTKRVDSSYPIEAVSLEPGCVVRAAEVWALHSPARVAPSL